MTYQPIVRPVCERCGRQVCYLTCPALQLPAVFPLLTLDQRFGPQRT